MFYLVNVYSQSVIEDDHLLSFSCAGVEEFMVFSCSHIQIYRRFSTWPDTDQGSCTHAEKLPKDIIFEEGVGIMRRRESVLY